jgi:hypothetical protein
MTTHMEKIARGNAKFRREGRKNANNALQAVVLSARDLGGVPDH